MSSDPSTDQARRTSIHEQRIKRQQTGKPNRAQVKAAQSRSIQTVAPTEPATLERSGEAIAIGGAPSAANRQKLTQAQRRAVERGAVARGSGMPYGVITLTREQEMLMIREDLRRLLIIAGGLLVAMIALLFVID